jgi:hypothetical protein
MLRTYAVGEFTSAGDMICMQMRIDYIPDLKAALVCSPQVEFDIVNRVANPPVDLIYLFTAGPQEAAVRVGLKQDVGSSSACLTRQSAVKIPMPQDVSQNRPSSPSFHRATPAF